MPDAPDEMTLMDQELALAEYLPQALATVQPEARSLSYLVPGIAGEVGELLGHTAKAVWHGTDEEDLCRELAYEYGDVAWMTAVLLDTTGRTALSADDAVQRRVDRWSADHPLTALFGRAAGLLKAHDDEDPDRVGAHAQHMWSSLATLAQATTGYSFEEILDMNVEKLASRAERGVLKGNGDHR